MFRKNRGFTLIETIAAILIVAAVVLTALNYGIKAIKQANYDQHANLALNIIKAADRRVEVDGYDYDSWATLPSAPNTDALISFSRKAFISKFNSECGASDGWVPELEESKKEALIDCNFSKDNYGLYDFKMIKSSDMENKLASFDIIMKINSKYSLDEKDYFLSHNRLLKRLNASHPIMKMGIFSANFVDFNDLLNEVGVEECQSLSNNCAIKISWRSDGYSENLRITGTNNMVKDSVSFAENYYESNKKCALWEYDDSSNYNLTTTQDCGIGIYNKTLKPIVAAVDVAVKDVSAYEPILLNNSCINYEKDVNGFIVENGTTQCGLYTGEDGTQNVVQIVDELSVDGNNSDSNPTMIVNNLILKELTAEELGITNLLSVIGSTQLNELVVEIGAESEFNNITRMDVINVLTKTHIKGSLEIDADNVTDDSLRVSRDLNIESTWDSDFTKDVNVGVDVLSHVFKLEPDSSLYNGKGCSYNENGDFGFDGNNVLVCRATGVSGIYKWASGRKGEIAAFTGSCPSGWTDFNDAGGRTLLGNGRVFDLRTGDTTYQVGDTGGEAFVALSQAEMAAHSHEYLDVMWSEHWGDTGAKNMVGDEGGQDNDNNWYTRQAITEKKGSGSAHENRMPYRAVKYCEFQEGDKEEESFLPVNPDSDYYWFPYPDYVGDWYNVGAGYGCSSFVYYDISGNEYWVRQCNQKQERQIREREINYITSEVRFTGSGYTESKTTKQPEVWIRDVPIYGDWYDIGTAYNCGSNPTSIVEGSSTYTITVQCYIDREREYQDQIKQVDSNGTTIQSQPWGPVNTEQNTFFVDVVYVINKSNVITGCNPWDIPPNETTYSKWTPDEKDYFEDEDVHQTRTAYKARECTVVGNASNGEWYELDRYIDYETVLQSQTVKGTKVRPVVTGTWAKRHYGETTNNYAKYIFYFWPNGTWEFSGNGVVKETGTSAEFGFWTKNNQYVKGREYEIRLTSGKFGWVRSSWSPMTSEFQTVLETNYPPLGEPDNNKWAEAHIEIRHIETGEIVTSGNIFANSRSCRGKC